MRTGRAARGVQTICVVMIRHDLDDFVSKHDTERRQPQDQGDESGVCGARHAWHGFCTCCLPVDSIR